MSDNKQPLEDKAIQLSYSAYNLITDEGKNHIKVVLLSDAQAEIGKKDRYISKIILSRKAPQSFSKIWLKEFSDLEAKNKELESFLSRVLDTEAIYSKNDGCKLSNEIEEYFKHLNK